MFIFIKRLNRLAKKHQPPIRKPKSQPEMHPYTVKIWRSLIESHNEVVEKTGTTDAEEIQIILGNKKKETR